MDVYMFISIHKISFSCFYKNQRTKAQIPEKMNMCIQFINCEKLQYI